MMEDKVGRINGALLRDLTPENKKEVLDQARRVLNFEADMVELHRTGSKGKVRVAASPYNRLKG